MKRLIAALIFGAIVLVPSSVSAQGTGFTSEDYSTRHASAGLDMGPRGDWGFTDNDGNHVKELVALWNQAPDGSLYDVLVRLSDGRPLSACDECRQTWESYKLSVENNTPIAPGATCQTDMRARCF